MDEASFVTTLPFIDGSSNKAATQGLMFQR